MLLRAGEKYTLGTVEHTLPWGLSRPYQYTTKEQNNHSTLLQLLGEIELLCELNNLEYWIAGPTLLGALRHQGFIPWNPNAYLEMERRSCATFLSLLKEQGYLLSSRKDKLTIKKRGSSGAVQVSFLSFAKGEKDYYTYHPRKRYRFESIALWGPCQGDKLCQERYGTEYLSQLIVKNTPALNEGFLTSLIQVFTGKALERCCSDPVEQRPEL